MNKRTYYQILGLEKYAFPEDIKKAYFSIAKKYHPDVDPHSDKNKHLFQEVQEAYTILGDAKKRRAYDKICIHPEEPDPEIVDKEISPKEEEILDYKKELTFSYLSRIFLAVFFYSGGFVAFLVIYKWLFVVGNIFDVTFILLIFASLFVTLILKFHQFFVLESYLSGYAKKYMYRFFKTLSFSLSIAYIFGYLAFLLVPQLDFFYYAGLASCAALFGALYIYGKK